MPIIAIVLLLFILFFFFIITIGNDKIAIVIVGLFFLILSWLITSYCLVSSVSTTSSFSEVNNIQVVYYEKKFYNLNKELGVCLKKDEKVEITDYCGYSLGIYWVSLRPDFKVYVPILR